MWVRTISTFGVKMPSCTTPMFFGLNITLVNSKSAFEIESTPYILIITARTGYQINNIGGVINKFTSDIIYSTCNRIKEPEPVTVAVKKNEIIYNMQLHHKKETGDLKEI